MSGAADTVARVLAERLAIPGIDAVVPFRVPLTTRFRGVTERHGLLLHGPHGWGEWSPFDEYPDDVAGVWLAAAIDAACTPPPPALRDVVPVNVTVPAVGPDEARAIVTAAGCATAKVKVAEPGQAFEDDLARVRAVRESLGSEGHIRIDANAAWTVEEAVAAIGALEEAAGGLEFAEQPCATLDALAEVRARTGVRIAADEAIRRDHADPSLVRDAVDVAVIKVQPSGGPTEALRLVRVLGLPVVVSSALETSIGLAVGVRVAAALERLDHACGLGTALLVRDDVTSDPLVPSGGAIAVRSAEVALQTSVIVPRAPGEGTRHRLLDRLARARRGHPGLSG